MPQGTVKSKPLTSNGGKVKIVRNAGVTKRGARTIAPKDGKKGGKRAEQAKLQKKLGAQMIASTEKRLAAKVGHLELLKGTKKDKPAVPAKK